MKNLTTFFFTFLVLLSFNGLTQNLLSDGDFSASSEILNCIDVTSPVPWCAFSTDPANIDVIVADEACVFHVVNPSPENWQVQLIQAGFILEAGHVYNLTFDVKADQTASFGVFLGEEGGNWANLIGFDRYWQGASTEWQTISLDFNSPIAFGAYKISFEMGNLEHTTLFLDNVTLTEMGTYTPTLGIVGDAVFGWDNDAIMETDDGEIFTLTAFPINSGGLKFRVDGNWIFNWGAPWDQPSTFPDGVAVRDGQNIPIPAPGNYDIMFNRITGEYHFNCVSNCSAEIGVTGTAVPPFFSYDDNYKMHSPDGENYFIPIRYFGDGEVKFRQLDNWDNNWGGTELHGIAIPEGPGIPVAEAFYSVHFNLNTLEYHFDYPFWGMVGSSLDGWENDIPMETEDGVHYALNERFFKQGEVKFRANGNWRFNYGTYWGNPSGGFPAEVAVRDQDNIHVPAGVYSVSLNLLTREYRFDGTPCITCPGDIYVFAEPDICGAVVEFTEPVVNEICGPNFTVDQIDGLPSGSVFPPGLTHQAFHAYNGEGIEMECHFNVFVEDNVPPRIENFTADYEMPWPPNHQMIPVTLNYNISDVCGGEITQWLNVWFNEDEEKGTGNTATDFEIIDDYHVLVRAERSGAGNGREYHILLGAMDENHNYDLQEVTVKVEHDMGMLENKSAVIAESDQATFDATLWPNPTRDKFYLKVNAAADVKSTCIIYDLHGRIIQINHLTNKIHSFGVDFSPGIYILQVRSSDEFKTFKIVKE